MKALYSLILAYTFTDKFIKFALKFSPFSFPIENIPTHNQKTHIEIMTKTSLKKEQ